MKLIPSSDDLFADNNFAKLPPDLQNAVQERLRAILEIYTAENVSKAVARIAARYNHIRGWTASVIRTFYYNFRRSRDWQVLLDKAKAGPRHRNKPETAALPNAFCEYVSQFWSRRQRGKFRAAFYDKIKPQYRRWRDGDTAAAFPGYFTCPEPRPDTGMPDGWTEGNLRRVAKKFSTAAARKAITVGPKAAYAVHGYKVPTTRVGVNVGQYYLFDDCWNDFRCLYRGKGSRILSLHVLDLASACNVLRGHKPTVEGETGIEERLKEREMLFLVAALLSNIGYRSAGTWLVMENRTATVHKDVDSILDKITGGAIHVSRGPLEGHGSIAGLFADGGGGNPRWKAPMESFFNLLHNRCDDLIEFPGQTGKNSRLDKPEGLELMERTDEAMHRAMQILSPERQRLIRFNMLQYEHAAMAIDAKCEVCNTRREHKIEGWREAGHKVPGFRLHPTMDFMPHWFLDRLDPDRQEAVRRLLATDPRLVGEVILNPREVFDAGASKLKKLTPQQTASFLTAIPGDAVTVKQGRIDFGVPEVDQENPLPFGPVLRDLRGGEVALRNGDKYSARVNPCDPRVIWLFDHRDAFQGVAAARPHAGTRADTAQLQEQFKAASKSNAGFMAEARQLAAPIAQNAADIASNNAAVIADHKNEQKDLKDAAVAALFD